MYIHTYVHTYVHTYTYKYIYIYIYLHIYTYTHIIILIIIMIILIIILIESPLFVIKTGAVLEVIGDEVVRVQGGGVPLVAVLTFLRFHVLA